MPEAPHPQKIYTCIGLMSGTSLDGVDAAVLDTDGYYCARPRGFVSLPYSDERRAQVRALFGRTEDSDGACAQAAADLMRDHMTAIDQLLEQTGLTAQHIQLIGLHGQTITHLPERHFTWQLAAPELLVKRYGVPVVHDFRSADVGAGGQGAPLIPLYHQALARQAALTLPVAIVNIGGVANITDVGAEIDD